MRATAKKTAETIKKRTRRGFGVDRNGGNQTRLKPLAKSTIENRKRRRLSSATSPRKSNLTDQGDMLDSLKGSVKSGEIVVEVTGTNNQKKSKEVQKVRPYLNLSRDELKKISKDLKKSLIGSIKRGL